MAAPGGSSAAGAKEDADDVDDVDDPPPLPFPSHLRLLLLSHFTLHTLHTPFPSASINLFSLVP